jgi:hypothetical protein
VDTDLSHNCASCPAWLVGLYFNNDHPVQHPYSCCQCRKMGAPLDHESHDPNRPSKMSHLGGSWGRLEDVHPACSPTSKKSVGSMPVGSMPSPRTPIVASPPPPSASLPDATLTPHFRSPCLVWRQLVWLPSWQLAQWSWLPDYPQRARPLAVPT